MAILESAHSMSNGEREEERGIYSPNTVHSGRLPEKAYTHLASHPYHVDIVMKHLQEINAIIHNKKQ